MSAWITHVKSVREQNPEMSYKLALVEASKTYKRADGKEIIRRKKRVKKVEEKEVKFDDAVTEIKSVGEVKEQDGSGPEHARFSSEIYEKPADRKDVKDWKYMGGTAQHGYWENESKIIIAYRGTVDKADVKTDAVLAVGMLKKTARYKKSLAYAKKIMKNAKVPVTIVGHSLGGSIASEVGKELNLKVWAYNPGKGPKEHATDKIDKIACALKSKSSRCKKAKLVNTVRTIGDPVSILGKKGVNVKHVVPKHLNVHSISNFEQLKD